jgi:uncharacterized protein
MAGKSRHGTHGARQGGRRSPFVLDISRLSLRPGATLDVHQTVPAPSRIGVELIAIAEGAPLELDLSLQSISDGVLVTGTASAPTEGECARCLTPVTGNVRITLSELFDFADADSEVGDEDDEVGHVVAGDSGDTVDIEQPIIDAVGMMLPFSPVCRYDCPGLCPECGVPLADFEGAGVEPHHHDVIDPRWAKLAAIIPIEQEEPSDRSAGDPE